jgi:hypothetical protein
VNCEFLSSFLGRLASCWSPLDAFERSGKACSLGDLRQDVVPAAEEEIVETLKMNEQSGYVIENKGQL